MEKLQLKMRMLNVAMTEESWRVFDSIIKCWQKIGVKDETVMIGGIMSTGTHEVMEGLSKINRRDLDILDKLKDIKIDKNNINESFNITI